VVLFVVEVKYKRFIVQDVVQPEGIFTNFRNAG